MKLTIRRKGHNYELNFIQLNQWVGHNMSLKNYMVASLVKHFYGAKYMEYESDMIENVRIDSEVLGRKYFNVIYIKDRETILSYLKMGKLSLLKDYVSNLVKNAVNKEYIERLDGALTILYQEINNSLHNTGINIEIGYEASLLDNLYTGPELEIDGYQLEESSNYRLLCELLTIVEQLQKANNTKTLIILENIDHLVERDEYKGLCQRIEILTQKSDTWTILTSSIDGFLCIDASTLEGVSVVHANIYSMPGFEEIKEFVQQNYPIEKRFTDQEIEALVEVSASKIGEQYIEDLRGHIVARLINKSEVFQNSCKPLSMPEMTFLSGQNML